MQHADDTDLIRALQSPLVRIKPLLEVDWAEDGYQSEYADMSSVVKNVKVDFSTIQGDLPAEVNTVVGSSSALMTVTLGGKRRSNEPRASQMLSDYWAPNPLWGSVSDSSVLKMVDGKPIRYSRRIYTRDGWRTVRQFTGWISEHTYDEETDEVTLVCSDVFDLQESEVTLPRWAIGPRPGHLLPPVGDGSKYSPMRPPETNWSYLETLRQAGRWGVPTRNVTSESDHQTFFYNTCNGAFHPSIGSYGDCDWSAYPHAVTWRLADPWEDGPHGLCAKGTYVDLSQTDGVFQGSNTLNWCMARARARFEPPADGTSWATKYSELSFWLYAQESGAGPGATSTDTQLWVHLGAAYAASELSEVGNTVWDESKILLMLGRNGGVQLMIDEDARLGRHWEWNWDALPEGWHWISLITEWTPTGIETTGKMKPLGSDTLVDMPFVSGSGPGTGRGFRYRQRMLSSEFGNPYWLIPSYTPIQHVSFSGGSDPIAFDPAKGDMPLRDGQPMADIERGETQQIWFPETYRENGWDVLKSIASAELGVLYTDEHGVIRFRKRDTVWDLGTDAFQNPFRLPIRDRSNLVFSPTLTTYRNAITISTRFTETMRAMAWANDDPTAFYVTDRSGPQQREVDLDEKVIAIYRGQRSLTTGEAPRHPSIYGSSAMTTRKGNIGSGGQTREWTRHAHGGWGINVQPFANQRAMRLLWNKAANGNLPGIYIGCAPVDDADTNQEPLSTPAWWIGGRVLHSTKTGTFTVENSEQIRYTARRAVLDISANDWLQSESDAIQIANSVLRDTVKLAPVIDPLSLPVGMATLLQHLDVVTIDGGDTVVGDLYCQVLGKTIEDTPGSQQDTMTVRVLNRPGGAIWSDPASGWGVGTWDE